ncbi:MAG TPA: POTRA domain-containing protein, partial [Sphingomonas sp.]
MLAGMPAVAQTVGALPASPAAQTGPSAATGPAAAQTPIAPQRLIRTLRVEGSQRIEPDTALSYTKLRAGQPYSNETVDQAISDLLESDLFADVTIAGVESGDLVIRVR